MLYEVPRGANDDWYWIFATLYEGRSRHANVLTNDLMRDHRLAFMEPRPFLRWRNAHVALYELLYAPDDDTRKPLIHMRNPGVYLLYLRHCCLCQLVLKAIVCVCRSCVRTGDTFGRGNGHGAYSINRRRLMALCRSEKRFEERGRH